MPYDFYSLLKKNDALLNMPSITIKKRVTDKSITYNKEKNRLDTIAGMIYQDETLWRIILWANKEYFIEFDIPDNVVIRVPYPLQDVIEEVQSQIISKKDRA